MYLLLQSMHTKQLLVGQTMLLVFKQFNNNRHYQNKETSFSGVSFLLHKNCGTLLEHRNGNNKQQSTASRGK